jgi:hypothetical protein
MSPDDEVARYREAARLTLQQLDWCVMYLHSIRKRDIARALAESSSAIASRFESIEPEGARISRPRAP